MPSRPSIYTWTAATSHGSVLTLRKMNGFVERGRGLLGHPELSEAHGFWFPSCRSIHTWFMPYPIDVIALDTSHTVVAILPKVLPWRMPPLPKTTRHIIECRAGEAARLGLSQKMQLALTPLS